MDSIGGFSAGGSCGSKVTRQVRSLIVPSRNNSRLSRVEIVHRSASGHSRARHASACARSVNRTIERSPFASGFTITRRADRLISEYSGYVMRIRVSMESRDVGFGGPIIARRTQQWQPVPVAMPRQQIVRLATRDRWLVENPARQSYFVGWQHR